MSNGMHRRHGPQSRGGHGGPGRGNAVPQPRTVTYFDGDHIRPALVDREAQDWAEKISGLKSTQLRRFFDEVKAIQRQIELAVGGGAEHDEAFRRVRPRFAMLKAKVLYAKGRLGNHFPDAFVQFFVDHTHAAKTYRDFSAFVQHFEAVVGFHKFLAKE